MSEKIMEKTHFITDDVGNLFFIHHTGTKHRVTKLLICGNNDKQVVLLFERNNDKPELVFTALCFKNKIPLGTLESDIRYFDNDIIWFVVSPPIDNINPSMIVEMNKSLIPLLHYCYKNIPIECNQKFLSKLSKETLEALSD